MEMACWLVVNIVALNGSLTGLLVGDTDGYKPQQAALDFVRLGND